MRKVLALIEGELKWVTAAFFQNQNCRDFLLLGLIYLIIITNFVIKLATDTLTLHSTCPILIMVSLNYDFPKLRCKGKLWILPTNVLNISVSFSVFSFFTKFGNLIYQWYFVLKLWGNDLGLLEITFSGNIKVSGRFWIKIILDGQPIRND